MSILMRDSGYQKATGTFVERYPTPDEERAIKIIESNKLKTTRVSPSKSSINIDAGRMF